MWCSGSFVVFTFLTVRSGGFESLYYPFYNQVVEPFLIAGKVGGMKSGCHDAETVIGILAPGEVMAL